MSSNVAGNIEELILNSELTGDLPGKLEQIPADDRGWFSTFLGKLVKVTPVQAYLDGVWKNVALVGYAGLSESGQNIRIVWTLTFPKPLSEVIRVTDDEEVAVASIRGNDYVFNKAGAYLGCVQLTQKSRHPQSL